MENIYCETCQELTQHSYEGQIMTFEEEQEQERQVIDDMAQDGFDGKLTSFFLKLPVIDGARQKVNKFWHDFNIGDYNEMYGKKIYKCSVCGRMTYID